MHIEQFYSCPYIQFLCVWYQKHDKLNACVITER